ncbi:MAG: hypothetical protein ACI965_000177 [Paraglaciecola sp.]|jgi:hypothetical protein
MDGQENFIKVIDNVLSEDLCKQFIHQFDRSQNTSTGRTGGGVDTDKKRSIDVSVSQHDEFKEQFQTLLPIVGQHIYAYFEEYFFALIGPLGLTVKHPKTGASVKLTSENFAEIGKPNLPNLIQHLFRLGDINAQKYIKQSGGYPYWHSEVYPVSGNTDPLHRIMLFMFYLNDVDDGGETEFYYQNMQVKPKAGRMVIAPAYFTHTHRGNVPVSNDKYILTSWVLFNQAERIYAAP